MSKNFSYSGFRAIKVLELLADGNLLKIESLDSDDENEDEAAPLTARIQKVWEFRNLDIREITCEGPKIYTLSFHFHSSMQ